MAVVTDGIFLLLITEQEGFDAGKTFLRRYDNKSEYMVRGGEYAECQRSYLGETMPPPVLPASLKYAGLDDLEGIGQCEHWIEELGISRVHVWVSLLGETRVPVRLTDEQVLSGESVPLMTYDWKDVKIGPPAASSSAPNTFSVPEPWGWRTCSRNIGGFPYLHIFHHYLRF